MENARNIEKVVENANECFSKAEVTVKDDRKQGVSLFIQGVSLLIRGFLEMHGVSASNDFEELIRELGRVEPDTVLVEAELEYLLHVDTDFDDAEDIIDTANEIWDFLIDLVTAEE